MVQQFNGTGAEAAALGSTSAVDALLRELEAESQPRHQSMTPEEIISAVSQHETDTQEIRDRMRFDMGLHALTPFKEQDANGNPVDGYYQFTSNSPRVDAEKIIGWVSQSEKSIRIDQADKPREQREVDNVKEKFCWAALRAADDLLRGQLKPDALDQFSSFGTVRGVVAGLWTIRNHEDGFSYAQIEPWDPLHTFWGSDMFGLTWACHRITSTVAEVRENFGVELSNLERHDQSEITIFDFYDRFNNLTVAESGEVLVDSEEHGGDGLVPVVISPVGSFPMIQTDGANADNAAVEKLWGDSIFGANRALYYEENYLKSINMELASRARKPPLGVRSVDGEKTLDQDIYQEGSTVSLAEGDEVGPLGLLQTAKDGDLMEAEISGMLQRGGLPYSVHGALQFQLSGFAINTLMASVQVHVKKVSKAIEHQYRAGLGIITRMYAGGRFDQIQGIAPESFGMFTQEMVPGIIAAGGTAEVTLSPVLPEDAGGKLANANMARQPNAAGVPLLPDRYIHDNILKIQDSDNLDQAIMHQVSGIGTPYGLLLNAARAAADQGDQQAAQMHLTNLEIQMLQQLIQLQQARQVAGQVGATPGVNGAGIPGVSTATASPESQGINEPPNPATVEGGRQGGQASPVDTLAAIGLVGPNG